MWLINQAHVKRYIKSEVEKQKKERVTRVSGEYLSHLNNMIRYQIERDIHAHYQGKTLRASE